MKKIVHVTKINKWQLFSLINLYMLIIKKDVKSSPHPSIGSAPFEINHQLSEKEGTSVKEQNLTLTITPILSILYICICI